MKIKLTAQKSAGVLICPNWMSLSFVVWNSLSVNSSRIIFVKKNIEGNTIPTTTVSYKKSNLLGSLYMFYLQNVLIITKNVNRIDSATLMWRKMSLVLCSAIAFVIHTARILNVLNKSHKNGNSRFFSSTKNTELSLETLDTLSVCIFKSLVNKQRVSIARMLNCSQWLRQPNKLHIRMKTAMNK